MLARREMFLFLLECNVVLGPFSFTLVPIGLAFVKLLWLVFVPFSFALVPLLELVFVANRIGLCPLFMTTFIT